MTAERLPKFRNIVDFARRQIDSGAWPCGVRLPSENELSGSFGVSRTTARRALDQLATDGLIVRRRGSGTYIAPMGVTSSFVQVRDIADEIAESGRSYSGQVLVLRAVKATCDAAAALTVDTGARIFRSAILHMADHEPLQLEYRYVNPAAVPDYLTADFTHQTPSNYLQSHCPLAEGSQSITAVLPTKRQAVLLKIRQRDPCLLVTRITASQHGVVSYARIFAPASRYRLSGRIRLTRSQSAILFAERNIANDNIIAASRNIG